MKPPASRHTSTTHTSTTGQFGAADHMTDSIHTSPDAQTDRTQVDPNAPVELPNRIDVTDLNIF